jgi:hypothetical protein
MRNLMKLAGSHIGVKEVHPGGVATSIADNARSPRGEDVVSVSRIRDDDRA